MELRLAIGCPDAPSVEVGRAVDIVATVEADHTVGELAAAVAYHLGVAGGGGDGGWLLARPATGEEFDAGERLGGLGLTSGDTLTLRSSDDPVAGPPPSPVAGGGWRIEVAGGPDTGRHHRLDLGAAARIGRDPGVEMALRDPRLGRVAVTVRLGVDEVATVDPVDGADIALDGMPVTTPVPWTSGQTLRCGASVLELRHRPGRYPVGAATSPTITLHRTAGCPRPPEEVVLRCAEGVPTEPEPVSFAYLAAAMPLVMGVGLAVLFSPRFLLFALFSPLMAVGGYLDQRRRARKRQRRLEKRFGRALDDLVVGATEAMVVERRRRRAHTPDLAELAHRVARRSPTLWGRTVGAPGEPSPLRCGMGTVTPLVTVEAPTGGEEELCALADERLAPLRLLIDVPVSVDLHMEPVVALSGPVGVTAPLATALTLQAAAHHRPTELVIVAALGPETGVGRWLPWLPHAAAAEVVVGHAPLADRRPAAESLLRSVLDIGERRSAHRRSPSDGTFVGGADTVRWPLVLVVLDAAAPLDPALLARLGALDRHSGVALLWLAPSAAAAPANTAVVIDCPPRTAPRLARLRRVGTSSAADVVDFEPDGVEPEVARPLALGLAPLIDAGAPDRVAALPDVVLLAEVLGDDLHRSERVVAAWRRPRRPSLAAPVGVGVDGLLVLDLVADGPHCLIGGTSGSGKSELTVSLVASLLANHPPDRLNVLFVDYKGGATGEAFAAAPHTVGCVTNLDGALAQRALSSLRAELQRRMDLLRGRARDVHELAEIDPSAAPPALVIVIDEFATLVAEVPTFLAGIIDLAQRGRSLGIHLVLATQRPAAAVSDNILANTNLRICLRTVDGAESTSVLGLADAAAIDPAAKGRALVRRGPTPPTAFQAAWSMAPPPSATVRPPVTVRPLVGTAAGAFPLPAEPTAVAGAGRPPTTQLDQLLAAIDGAAEAMDLDPGRPPWLPELPHTLTLDEVSALATVAAPDEPGVDIGLVDDPAEQARRPARVDVAATGGLLVVGAAGSGKTTVLETVASSSARSPAPPIVFALGVAARGVAALAARPGYAAVAGSDDLEAATRLIAVLEREVIDRRRDRTAAERPLLLLIDDYGALAQTFEGAGVPSSHHQWLERLNRLIVDGRHVGLATAVTADRRAAVRAALWSALGTKLVLRCVDDTAYRDLGVDPALLDAGVPAGRGVLDGRLVQVAVPPSEAKAAARAGSAVPGRLRVPPLPADLAPQAIPPPSNRGSTVRRALPLGLGCIDLVAEPFEIDLALDDVAVLGPPRSGRSTTLAMVARRAAALGRTVVACGPRRSPLAELLAVDRWFTLDGSPALDGLADLVTRADPERPPVLLLDGADQLDDPSLEAASARIAAAGLPLVASATSLRGYGTNPLWQQARRARSLILLGPPTPLEIHDLAGVAVGVRPGVEPTPGRAVAIVEGRPRLVQIGNALADTVADAVGDRAAVVETDIEHETRLITARMPGVDQYVLDRTITGDGAYGIADHHHDRLFGPAEKTPGSEG